MTQSIRVLRRVLRWALFGMVLSVFLAHALVRQAAIDRIYTDPTALPVRDAALLLGTSPSTRSGRANPFFEHRLDAAAELVRAGRVRVVVVSGDNSHRSYNEPAAMRRALVARGIDEERIVEDFAGLRTLDSVVRMNLVFGQDDFVVVSQRFHVERALFLAAARGIEAVGFAAGDAEGPGAISVRLREYAARVKAVLDAYLLRTEPRFLGDAVPIEFPPDTP